MRHLQRLTTPALALAVVLILTPLMELVVALWPATPGQASWRVGAVGLVSRSLVTPLLGVLAILAAGLVAERRGVVRGFAVLSSFLVLFIGGSLGLYLIDALEVRGLMTPEQKGRFDVTAAVAVAKLVMAGLVSAAFTVVGWRAAGAMGEGSGRGAPSAAPGIVTAGSGRGSSRRAGDADAGPSHSEIVEGAPTAGS
jgi:hypothetical protein